MTRVRFAPSPTGYIHIGNTRIALFNWLFALQNKSENNKNTPQMYGDGRSQFILRYDDTDTERSKQEYIDGIAEDMTWLGIKPDEVYFQSKRFDRYNLITQALKDSGLLYPCYETAEELERRRKIRLSRKLPPIYGRESLKLTQEEIQKFEKEGRTPHWRFLLPNFENNDPFSINRSEVHWDDVVRGRQTVDLASVSDPVLIRGDGSYLYTLPSVVDDMDMGVTHIIRGDDHVTNTGVQIAIFRALEAVVPTFGHINLLTTASGEGLSKRKGALSIKSLREDDYEPMAVASLASLTGTSENVAAYKNMEELVEHFSLSSVSKSAAKFDSDDLLNLNRHIVHKLTYDEVQSRLTDLGITGEKAKSFWTIIRGNINKVSDAKYWWSIVNDIELNFSTKDKDEASFLLKTVEVLPVEPWSHDTWKQWTNEIKKITERKGKDLFKPLRFALTGQTSGPELADLLPLIGKELAVTRLKLNENFK